LATHLSRRHLAGYASGSIATGVFSTVPGLLLLYYLTNVLGVATGVAGVIVLAPKLWDVVVNPVVGVVSDRVATRWGSRTPVLLAGSVILPVGLAVLFAVPHLPLGGIAVWVVVAYSVCATGYSLFQVPYAAVPAEVTDDYDERTTLNGWRMVVLTIGVLISGALAPAIVSLAGSGRPGYALMGVIVAMLVLLSALTSTREISRIPVVQRRSTAASVRDQVRMLRSNRAFAILMLVYFGQALAIGAQLAAEPYFATYTLHDTGATSAMFVALVGPALLVMPFWFRRSERLGKARILVEASCLYAATSIVLVASPNLPHGAVFALAAVIGVGFAGMQMVPYAMLPDTVDAGAAARDASEPPDADGDDEGGQAGALSGLWIAGETLGFALGPAILAAVLSIGHFHSTVDAHRVPQTAAALQAVRFGFTLLPAALLLSTLPFLRAYHVPTTRRATKEDTVHATA
jgi:glycoside/pentoside/hexuronide:cation symporter, GPH family